MYPSIFSLAESICDINFTQPASAALTERLTAPAYPGTHSSPGSTVRCVRFCSASSVQLHLHEQQCGLLDQNPFLESIVIPNISSEVIWKLSEKSEKQQLNNSSRQTCEKLDTSDRDGQSSPPSL